MITTGRMPQKIKRFFEPLRNHFQAKAWAHFWALVMAVTVSDGATVERLSKRLRNSTHRTNHGEFLWRSAWDHTGLMRQVALTTLGRLYSSNDRRLFLILDETQAPKRARRMDAVGAVHLHASHRFATGHTILKSCLYYRGVAIPWGSQPYVKKQHAAGLHRPFKSLTQLAAESIRGAEVPARFEVTVLFDAFYLCPVVTQACR